MFLLYYVITFLERHLAKAQKIKPLMTLLRHYLYILSMESLFQMSCLSDQLSKTKFTKILNRKAADHNGCSFSLMNSL